MEGGRALLDVNVAASSSTLQIVPRNSWEESCALKDVAGTKIVIGRIHFHQELLLRVPS